MAPEVSTWTLPTRGQSAVRRDQVFEDSERTNKPLKSVVQRVFTKDLSQELKLNNCFDHD